ncbi:MAG TPA: peptide ligase PGM1-related protein [Beijerinckiaceae bacterium]|nr:peptide ligase PGM1-related protein [Beijerinckiaceae bacterium]
MTAAAPGPDMPPTPADRARFAGLQADFARSFARLVTDPNAPRTVVILPSLSLDADVLARISGVHHYEERMLCLLLLLRMPRTEVIYLTSMPIPDTIIDYYLHLLPGIPMQHARRRLTLIACDDASPVALSRKLLARPRLLSRIGESIRHPKDAHLSCFNVTDDERRLALALNLPIYGCDPDLAHWGSKSGSRKVFRAAGLDMPAGAEDLRDQQDIVDALLDLKRRKPGLRRAVVKLNEGFSGEGNATFRFDGAPEGASLAPWLKGRLPHLAFEASGMTWDLFRSKFSAMGGIVEEWVEGAAKRSPSAQMRVDPGGQPQAISTHDQVLGGPSGQIFLGATFPADAAYRKTVQDAGLAAASVLAEKGVIGRFGVDFLSVPEGGGWSHKAIEINLRKGGTTHPFLMLQFLTDGTYDTESGQFHAAAGQPRCYYATDTLEAKRYRGLTPADLIDIAALNGLYFHAGQQEGVTFHLIGALSEFGKLGVVAIGADPARADALYRRTVAALDRETA